MVQIPGPGDYDIASPRREPSAEEAAQAEERWLRAERFKAMELSGLFLRNRKALAEAKAATPPDGFEGFAARHVGAAFDADVTAARARAPDQEAAALLDEAAALLKPTLFERAKLTEAVAVPTWRPFAVQGRIDEVVAAAFSEPDAYLESAALITGLVASEMAEKPAESQRTALRAQLASLAWSTGQGLIEDGLFEAAEAFLDAAGDGDKGVHLAAAEVAALRHRLAYRRRQAERLGRAELAGRIAAQVASIREAGRGDEFLAEEAREVLDSEAFADFDRSQRLAQEHFDVLDPLRLAPADEVAEALEARRPKPGSKDFADRAELFAALQDGARAMLAQREADGAGHVMAMGRLRQVFAEGRGARLAPG